MKTFGAVEAGDEEEDNEDILQGARAVAERVGVAKGQERSGTKKAGMKVSNCEGGGRVRVRVSDLG